MKTIYVKTVDAVLFVNNKTSVLYRTLVLKIYLWIVFILQCRSFLLFDTSAFATSFAEKI